MKEVTKINDWGDISEWLEWWLSQPRLTSKYQNVLEKYYSSYKEFFPRYIKEHYTRQTKEVTDFVLKSESIRILEVGCGCGTESLWFGLQGASVIGIDLNKERLAVAGERRKLIEKKLGLNLDVNFKCSNFFDFDCSEKFDLVWMEQAFHHVEPRNQVPSKIASLLRPGGHVILSEANAWNPLIQLHLFRKRGFRTLREYYDSDGKKHMYGNERVTTPGSIAMLFVDQNSFQKLSASYFRTLPNFNAVEKFSWVDQFVPNWLAPAFTHFNIVFKKNLIESNIN